FPGVGAIVYLLLASPSVRRTRKRKRLTKAAARKLIAERVGASPGSFPPEGNSMLRLTTSLTGLLPSAGNAVELLADADGAFDRIENALRAAKRSVWAQYYIIRNDETGHRFLELLAAKAAAGVEVRLLYDAVGSMGLDAKRLAAIARAGGRVEAFLPVNPLRRRWAIHLR